MDKLQKKTGNNHDQANGNYHDEHGHFDRVSCSVGAWEKDCTNLGGLSSGGGSRSGGGASTASVEMPKHVSVSVTVEDTIMRSPRSRRRKVQSMVGYDAGHVMPRCLQASDNPHSKSAHSHTHCVTSLTLANTERQETRESFLNDKLRKMCTFEHDLDASSTMGF